MLLTLFSYPDLFGVADNNPYGLKIFCFLKLCRLPFRHVHILDTRGAPRGQLPYIEEDGQIVGDSDAIVAHLTRRHGLEIDANLSPEQRRLDVMLRRLMDDLYWVMSYSRWRDDDFWPAFRDALLKTHSDLTSEALEKAREYNFQRYYFQGIGRYTPQQVYARGLEDLEAVAELTPDQRFFFGTDATSTDAALYGFLANIHFFEIDTPLKRFLDARSNLVRHCELLHSLAA